MSTQAKNNFDFNQFNSMVQNTPAGLKLALAEGLLKDALWNLERYNNPLADECQEQLNGIKTFRIKYKAMVAARQAKNESTAPMAADGGSADSTREQLGQAQQ